MSRIAGYIHWGCLSSDNAENSVRSILRHMTGSSGTLLITPLGVVGIQGSAGGVAQQGDTVLVLDGRLLDRSSLDDGGPGGDAGLLLRLCLCLGFEAALQAVEGDIAVALLDGAEHRLWLGRDRFGIKPIYHAATPHGTAFASLPAPLARLNGVGSTVNRRFAGLVAGSHYRTFDNAVTDSPFAAVRQIPAAYFLCAERSSESRTSPYWKLQVQDLGTTDEDVLAGRYNELLLNAVRRRLAVAHRPAFTLSGGMDSSSILCSATRITGRPQAAFSSVYVDPTYDERNEIKDVIEAGMAEWHPVEIPDDVDVLDRIQRLVRVHNEPVATATWLSHEILCGAVAAAGHGALFGGLGGDELNAGEYEYFPLFFADVESSGNIELLDREIGAWTHFHNHPLHRKTPAIARQMMETLTSKGSSGHCLPNLERQNRYASAVNPDWFDVASFVPVMDHPFSTFLANRAYQDLVRETTPCCLRAEDRQCSVHGLEHFNPFLDKALVEFMFSVPATLKIRNGITKYLLRKATVGLLPDATRARVKKTGWNAPAHLWFSTGRGLEALSDIVASSDFKNRGIYDVVEVNRIIAEHHDIVDAGLNCENHMMFLWQVLNVESWLSWVENGLFSEFEKSGDN